MQDYIVQLSNSDSKHCKLFYTTKLFNNYFVIILHLYKLKLKVMEKFKEYKRSKIAELREISLDDIRAMKDTGELTFTIDSGRITVSISEEDLKKGSPKIGDMIARNPKNHKDQWLVAEQYANDNFEVIK